MEIEDKKKAQDEEDDILLVPEWKEKKKHIFILSSAGKPIYSRHGSEDRLVTLFGVMQALVSFVQDSQDTIQSIKAGNVTIAFLIKGPIILVSVSRIGESVDHMRLQLLYVYNQVVSVLTLTQLTRVFEQRGNFDLRRLLAGSERLIDHLLHFTETQPGFLLGAVKCLPMSSSTRDLISQTIVNSCAKIKNLVFAILIADNKLITVVKMKKYNLHPADLHIIFNMVNSSESFKPAESWTPICLPTFDASAYMHGHVSYLSEDCEACLLLLSIDRDMFFNLSEAKQTIVDVSCCSIFQTGLGDENPTPDKSPSKTATHHAIKTSRKQQPILSILFPAEEQPAPEESLPATTLQQELMHYNNEEIPSPPKINNRQEETATMYLHTTPVHQSTPQQTKDPDREDNIQDKRSDHRKLKALKGEETQGLVAGGHLIEKSIP
ncbi:protein SAND-like [Nilaparvata lugens]|uniref:protein SAND-like n=1 Tax=Nilaparvata lugens TaxID=108931 RepID=UPI00193CF703|nr:protein SAND-like [Nilaparvata lugens]